MQEVIIIGTGLYTSILDFAMIGKKVVNSPSPISIVKSALKPADWVDRIYADTSKAETLLLWSPKFQVRDGIRDFPIG
ncbi:hypothetical protein ApAK_04000 [Thermoplasmatales archaeon AK]|nr:hypothetical protein [Thermoplasmatales archaeon AK]